MLQILFLNFGLDNTANFKEIRPPLVFPPPPPSSKFKFSSSFSTPRMITSNTLWLFPLYVHIYCLGIQNTSNFYSGMTESEFSMNCSNNAFSFHIRLLKTKFSRATGRSQMGCIPHNDFALKWQLPLSILVFKELSCCCAKILNSQDLSLLLYITRQFLVYLQILCCLLKIEQPRYHNL